MKVQKTFNRLAKHYDTERRKLIPCFDDFYGSVAKVLAFGPKAKIKVLDLGAGTGILSEFVHQKFPKAEITLCDFAPAMLEKAKQRFQKNKQINYLCFDYIREDLMGSWDAIISSLSIHHLSFKQKKSLYLKIYKSLKNDGIFINADNVKGPTPLLDKLYKKEWKESVKSQGISAKAWKAALIRTQIDQLSPLADQLKLLQEIGFRQVDCFYKNFQRAVFGGRK